MSDWDHDGDEDYVDGIIEGAFWAGPGWLAALICVVSLAILGWRYLS